MKTTRALLTMLGGVLLVAVFAAHAQFDKKTVVTFSQPVQVPGLTLPAGTYTFTIFNALDTRTIVQIWNADKTELVTTILAIPNSRLEFANEPIIEFHEQPAGTAQAVKAWFYPGFKSGIEFVYPKKEAVQIAQAANEVVPAAAEEPTPDNMMRALLFAITPKGNVERLAEAFPAQAAEQKAEQPKLVAEELPKTASPLPLIALLGASSVLIGFGIRRFAGKMR